MSIKKMDFLKFGDDLYEMTPPVPSETERGGIIASPKSSTETVEIKLGDDGKLYAPKYPDLTDINNALALKADVEYVDNTINSSLPIVPIDELEKYGAEIVNEEGEDADGKYIMKYIYIKSDLITPDKIFRLYTRDKDNKIVCTAIYYRSKNNVDTQLFFVSPAITESMNYYYTFNNRDSRKSLEFGTSATYQYILINDILSRIQYDIALDWDTSEIVKRVHHNSVDTNDVLLYANKNSKEKSYSPSVDTDVATKGYVDTSITDVINEIIPTEEETLRMLAETGIIDLVTDINGDLFTDENKNSIVF